VEAPDQVGVCVLRVWRYGDAVVVRLHTRTDVESPATERVIVAGEVEAALAEIRQFLQDY
jgi:hypothetical protein